MSWLEHQIKGKNVLYTGLIPGLETEAAEIALRLKIPYISVIQYKNQHLRWPTKAKNKYLRLLKKSVRVIYVDREPGHVSDTDPPDIHAPGKVLEQVRWLTNKVDKSLGVTSIIVYHGHPSIRHQILYSILYRMEGKALVRNKAHIGIPYYKPEDDLPF